MIQGSINGSAWTVKVPVRCANRKLNPESTARNWGGWKRPIWIWIMSCRIFGILNPKYAGCICVAAAAVSLRLCQALCGGDRTLQRNTYDRSRWLSPDSGPAENHCSEYGTFYLENFQCMFSSDSDSNKCVCLCVGGAGSGERLFAVRECGCGCQFTSTVIAL